MEKKTFNDAHQVIMHHANNVKNKKELGEVISDYSLQQEYNAKLKEIGWTFLDYLKVYRKRSKANIKKFNISFDKE